MLRAFLTQYSDAEDGLQLVARNLPVSCSGVAKVETTLEGLRISAKFSESKGTGTERNLTLTKEMP